MKEKDLNLKLISEFPELEKEYKKYVEWQDGDNTGSILVYEDVFVPYVIKQLVINNKEKLVKIANFIEQIYLTNDEYAMNVIYIGVLESLKSNINAKNIKFYLKGTTLKKYNELVY